MADFIIAFLVAVLAGLTTHYIIKHIESKKK